MLDLESSVSEGPSGNWEISEIIFHKIDGKKVGQ